jgi:hypothetical protein
MCNSWAHNNVSGSIWHLAPFVNYVLACSEFLICSWELARSLDVHSHTMDQRKPRPLKWVVGNVEAEIRHWVATSCELLIHFRTSILTLAVWIIFFLNKMPTFLRCEFASVTKRNIAPKNAPKSVKLLSIWLLVLWQGVGVCEVLWLSLWLILGNGSSFAHWYKKHQKTILCVQIFARDI